MVTCCHNTALPPQDGGRAGTAASLGAMAAAFLRALLLLAAPSSGQPAWDPGGCRASGAAVNGGLLGEAAEGRVAGGEGKRGSVCGGTFPD